MRRLLVLAGALALSASALPAQQLTVVQHATVHLFPSGDSRRIGSAHRGEMVFLLSELSGYDRVVLPDSSVGWIDARYLRPQDVEFAVQQSGSPMVRASGSPAVRRNASPAARSDDRTIARAEGRRPAIADGASAAGSTTGATAVDTGTAAAPKTAPAAHGSVADLPHPAPHEKRDPACADIGRGNRDGTPVDTATDLLKNRVDVGAYHDVTFREVLRLPWRGLARRRYEWTDAQKRDVAKDEGAAISLVGYIVSARTEGSEQTNCELADPEWHDWHVWLVRTEAEASARDKHQAIVVEITPRVRRLDEGRFDMRQIRQWAREGQRVRVSGWLLLDPDHPDEVGESRGTIWEIHPVMEIEPAP